MPVVEIRDLHKRFGNVEAVKGLSFEIEAGRVTRFRSGRLPEVAWVERCG